MTRKLRSNFEPGSSRWAVRRSQWKALGLSDEDMEKPKIAVVNTSSELSSCFSHLDGVAAKMKEAIRAAGGLPFEVRTGAPLGLAQNGDRISIDVEKRVVDLDVPQMDLAARRARLQPFASAQEKGWLSIYERTVQPLSRGAVLRK